MTSLADVFITGRLDTSRFGSDIKSGMNSRGVTSSMDASGKQAGSKFSGAFKNALKIGGAIAAAGAVTGGVRFFKGAIEEADEARKVGAQTAAVLKSTGGQAGITAKGIGDLASAISKKVGVDDEAIQSGANLLLTFKDVKNEAGKGNDIFSQATSLITDMSAAMGTDLKGSAIQVGKALNDPIKGISALSRVGVSFTDQQKAMITALVKGGDANAAVASGLVADTKEYQDRLKAAGGDGVKVYEDLTKGMSKAQKKQFDYLSEGGHQMDAQKKILKELNSEFKGSAEAQVTPAEKAKVAWGNFKEEIGTAVLPMVDRLATWFVEDGLPAIEKFGAAMTKTAGFVSDHKVAIGILTGAMGALLAVTKTHTAFLAVQAAGGLASYIKGTRIVTSVTKVWTAVQWAMNAALSANPIGLAVIAIAALVGGLVIAYKKSDTFRAIVDKTWSVVKDAIVGAWEDFIKPAFSAMKKFLTETLPNAWDKVKSSTKLATLWVVDKVLWMAEGMLDAMSVAFSWVPKLGDKIKNAKGAITDLRQHLNSEMDKMQDEEVDIKIKASTLKAATNFVTSGTLPRSGGAGGAGPIPRGAFGGAGSLDLKAKTQDARAGIARATSSASATAAAIAAELTKQAKAAAAAMGPMGKAGRVLPRGSYSIGMPYHGYPGHNGADYPAATGTPISSPWAGQVITSANLGDRSYGRYVKIAHGNGLTTLYAHMSQLGISSGATVRPGQFIGRVGEYGNATGPHLHFEAARNGVTFDPKSLGIFDKGGIMRGLGMNLSGQPERVLSPKQTRDFERLTDVLDRATSRVGGGAGPAVINIYDVDGRLMGTMRGEIDDDRAFRGTLGRQGAV